MGVKNEITVEARVENIGAITDFVEANLPVPDASPKAIMQIDLAIDELVANIASYAYGQETGPVTVRMETFENPKSVALTFVDHGAPFDPLAEEDPDITLPAEERPVGGLGILLVKKTMDAVSYTRRDGQNMLTIKKRLD